MRRVTGKRTRGKESVEFQISFRQGIKVKHQSFKLEVNWLRELVNHANDDGWLVTE